MVSLPSNQLLTSREGGIILVPPQRILCSTDFSDASLHGVRAADALARHFDAELVLVHVVEPIPIPATGTLSGTTAAAAFNVGAYGAQLREDAEQHLRSLIDERSAVQGPVDIRVLDGQPADRLVEAAAELEVDMLVIATHGRSGLGRLFHGSVAERVARSASCPVLMVPVPDQDAD